MSTTRHSPSSQRGIALVSAIFILVVLVALVVAITLFTSQSETGQVRDRFGSRAYHAARTGLEWGAYQVLDPRNLTATAGNAPLPNCPNAAIPNTCPTAAAPSSSTLNAAWFAGTVLQGYAVTVQCSCADFVEAGRNVRVYQLRSTATFGAGVSAVERQVAARMSYCRDPGGNPGSQPPYGCI